MSKFNIGDRVISKGYPHLGEEVGIVAGIDIGADAGDGKYLVKFNSLDIYTGWGYGVFCYDSDIIVEPYEGYAEWVDEDDLVKVEDECEKGIKSEFNVGDKVVAKDYPSIVKEVGIIVGIDPREECFGKYLVKFDSLDGDNGWAYGVFINNSYYNIEPYEGRAIWLDDLEKVEEECEEEKCEEGEVYMNEFNIGDKVIAKNGSYFGEEVGIVVGIDPREDAKGGKYLVEFNSLDISEGLDYGMFRNNTIYIIEPYEGYATWLDYLEKVEEECEENEFEKDIRMKFERIRKQKEETIKEMNKKVWELTLEIKEIESKIEKIKKEWRLD